MHIHQATVKIKMTYYNTCWQGHGGASRELCCLWEGRKDEEGVLCDYTDYKF